MRDDVGEVGGGREAEESRGVGCVCKGQDGRCERRGGECEKRCEMR